MTLSSASLLSVFLSRYDFKNITCENPTNVPHEEREETHDAVDDDIF